MTGTSVPSTAAAADRRAAPTPAPRSAAEGLAAAAGPAGGDQHLMLVGSSGGHLAQLVALRPWWATRHRTWVTFRLSDAESVLRHERNVVWAYHPTTRNLVNLVRNTWLAWRTLRRVQPDVIVSTGAGVAYPFFVIAKLRGILTVYIEVYDRVSTRTLSGRLCRPVTDLFCVQWPEQQRLYPGSIVIGPLL